MSSRPSLIGCFFCRSAIRRHSRLLFSAGDIGRRGVCVPYRMAGLCWPEARHGAATLASYICFTHGTVMPFTQPVFSAGFSIAAAASYQHFVVRRRMLAAEAEKSRYQQAMHFVTHEMRTPLSAIQGSSELISRYALTRGEAQADRAADQFGIEAAGADGRDLSERGAALGRADGVEARSDSAVTEMVASAWSASRPLAERKQIAIHFEPMPASCTLTGDRELMEYACYNLLTNAVKYSPPADRSHGHRRDAMASHVRIAVQDQGIGMDQKEVQADLPEVLPHEKEPKNRAKRAPESGFRSSNRSSAARRRDRSDQPARRGLVFYPGIARAADIAQHGGIDK